MPYLHPDTPEYDLLYLPCAAIGLISNHGVGAVRNDEGDEIFRRGTGPTKDELVRGAQEYIEGVAKEYGLRDDELAIMYLGITDGEKKKIKGWKIPRKFKPNKRVLWEQMFKTAVQSIHKFCLEHGTKLN